MKELIAFIARSLVDNPEAVRVEEYLRGGQTYIELHVAAEDMGRVIGKDGKVANAMRALLRMVAARQGQRVQLEIV